MRLEHLGWNGFFEAVWNSVERNDTRPGRVTAQHRGAWEIAGLFGESSAEASGRLRADSADNGLWPAVGDWVAVGGEPGGGMTICEVLPRRTEIARKMAGRQNRPQVLAANIDTIFLVMGLDGDYNPRRMERYLVQVSESGARPVVLLNKADIQEDARIFAGEIRGDAPGLDVHCLSAMTGAGLEALEPYITEGQTVALLGSSGVGKSTLLNRLLRTERQATQPVRERDSRGRHTTTARQLFFVSTGAMVIDTPGLREIQLWGREQGLASAFPELEALAQFCRFGDCRHESEPGCAVRQALEQGDLDEGQLNNYHKLQREQGAHLRRVNRKAQYQAKREVKKTSRAVRRLYQERDKL